MAPANLARRYPSPEGKQVTGPGGGAGGVAAHAAEPNRVTIVNARSAKIGIISHMVPRLTKTLLRLVGGSAIAVAIGLGACSLMAPKFTRPNVTVISVQMRNGNLLTQNFAVKLNIQNPNDRALPVRGLHAELSIGGDQIATGVSDRAVVIAPYGESEFDVTVTANMALALLKLNDKINQHAESIAYEVTGAASIDLPFLTNLPFHQSGSFPLQGIVTH
jgi:LEA14-like dessication related protein